MQSLADEWLIKNQHKILIFPWFIDYFLGTRRHIAKKTSKYDAGFHFLNEQGDVDESGTWYKLNFGSERFLACLLRGLNCPNWKKFVFLRVMDRFRGTRRQWRRVPLKKTKSLSIGRPKNRKLGDAKGLHWWQGYDRVQVSNTRHILLEDNVW